MRPLRRFHRSNFPGRTQIHPTQANPGQLFLTFPTLSRAMSRIGYARWKNTLAAHGEDLFGSEGVILVSRETLLQARLLPMALSAAILLIAFVQVRSGGVAILRWFLACLQASFPVLLTLLLPLRRRAVVTTWQDLPTQSQASYHSASSIPSARRPSGFDGVNEEANIRANAAVVDGHADVHASAVMTDDNDDDAEVGNLDDTLSEILGVSSRVATSLDLDLTFGAVDVHDNLAFTSLLSPLSSLPPPIASPPPSAAAGEPI